MFFSAVLITGGGDSSNRYRRSTEIYNPVSKTSCSLPKLPKESKGKGKGRSFHSQDGELACGGGGTSAKKTCVRWSPASGTWTKSHTLREPRYGHVSWATSSGVYLIGGDLSLRTSERVWVNGSVENGFSLKYDTRLQVID